MRVDVNGIRLFFDVEGAKLVPDGPVMREKPTVVLLPGGPGSDHSVYRPLFSRLADVAQLVYIDHRGEGRSDPGEPADWNLKRWGDDVYAFCRALEIEKPIVFGQSFGGFVAIAYATRHPEHPGKLVLSSTTARAHAHAARSVELFEEFGGPEVGEMARRFFFGLGDVDPKDTDAANRYRMEWMTKAMPLYNRTAVRDPDAAARVVANVAVLMHFMAPDGEMRSFDMLADLARIACPTLVLGGEDDPMTPIEDQEDIAAAIPQHLVRFERFAGAGHGAYRSYPDAVFPIIREFIQS